MTTYKNIEISLIYNISTATVTRWVENALSGKNSLELETINNKSRILKNKHNEALMWQLKEYGINYKNKVDNIEIHPTKDFYKIFNKSQIIELIKSLETKNEIPLKFTYLNDGAKLWDESYQIGLKSGTYKAITETEEMLDNVFDALISFTREFDKINIVDIGQGNSYTTKRFIEKLKNTGKLSKYVAVDISPEMNAISKKYINTWFPDLEHVSYVHDIEKSDISEILFDQKPENKYINVVLFVGNTLGNTKNNETIINNLRSSFDKDDVLIISNKLEKKDNKTDFIQPLSSKPERHLLVPKLLGINIKQCKYEFRYDDSINAKIGYLKLDKNYTIQFDFGNNYTRQLEILKTKDICIFIHKMSTQEGLIRMLENYDFEVIQMIKDSNLSHILTLSHLKD